MARKSGYRGGAEGGEMKSWRRALIAWFVISAAWAGYWAGRFQDTWTDPCVAHPHDFCLFTHNGYQEIVAIEFLYYGLGPPILIFVLGLLTLAGMRLLRRVRNSN
jgi:hypothetical protein